MKHSVDRNNFFGNVMMRRSGQVFLLGNKKPGVRDLGSREAPEPRLVLVYAVSNTFFIAQQGERMGPMRGQTQPNGRSVGSALHIDVTPEQIINQDNAVRTVERQAALLQMVHCMVLSLCNDASSTGSTSLSYKELCDMEIAIGSIVESLEAACKQ